MNCKSILLGCLISWQLSVSAQNTPVPDVLNEINHYETKANTLQKLERKPVKIAVKTKALGFGGGDMVFEMEGDRSPVRIAQSDTIRFVVSLADASGDPSRAFNLYKASVKKKKRTGKYSHSSGYFGKKSGTGDVIIYTVRKIKDGAFEIILTSKLEAGEYLFVNVSSLPAYGGNGADAFAFGVD
jgi:hypothetical protein